MKYLGGKYKIKKYVSQIILDMNPDLPLVSPFCGSAWVESMIPGIKLLYDKHPYLIALWRALQEGWEPPENLSKEEHAELKQNPDANPALAGFAGFACSYAGKWMNSYATDSTGRNYAKEGRNSLLKKIKSFPKETTHFAVADYSELDPIDSFVYCDPPYYGTGGYDKKLVGSFNHEEFWDTMRCWAENNIILVSEYTAPEDFKCVWEYKTKVSSNHTGNNAERIERLFTIKKPTETVQ